MRFAEGTSCAGVFTRHGVGSAPVDWCKRQLAASKGEDVRALVVNAGCANSFTGKPGADAVRRVATAVGKRFDCRQRDVMMASTGVIGVILDDSKIISNLREVETRLTEDAWAGAASAIMTTDTFPKRRLRHGADRRARGADRRHHQGLGHDRARHGHHAGLRGHRRGHRPGRPADPGQPLHPHHLQLRDGGRRPLDQRHPAAVRHRQVRRAQDPPGRRPAAWPTSARSWRPCCWTWPCSWSATARAPPSSSRSPSTAPRARCRPARSPAPSPRARWSRPPSPARTPTGAASSWPWAAPTSRSTASSISVKFGDLFAARDGLVSADYDEATMSAVRQAAGVRGLGGRRRRQGLGHGLDLRPDQAVRGDQRGLPVLKTLAHPGESRDPSSSLIVRSGQDRQRSAWVPAFAGMSGIFGEAQ